MTAPTTAAARLAALVGTTEIIEQKLYARDGHTILVASVVGDEDSDDEDYYADELAVAWDAALDVPGEAGSCWVAAAEIGTWLSLRWPATIGGPGFARDGEWYTDGMHAVRHP